MTRIPRTVPLGRGRSIRPCRGGVGGRITELEDEQDVSYAVHEKEMAMSWTRKMSLNQLLSVLGKVPDSGPPKKSTENFHEVVASVFRRLLIKRLDLSEKWLAKIAKAGEHRNKEMNNDR